MFFVLGIIHDVLTMAVQLMLSLNNKQNGKIFVDSVENILTKEQIAIIKTRIDKG